MINRKLNPRTNLAFFKSALVIAAAGLITIGAQSAVTQATESKGFSGPGSRFGGGTSLTQQELQLLQQFQLTQQQGDDSVNVNVDDDDDVDYFALALPNLVAANCAGSSYAVGGGGGGIGFGFGQATIDQNCQIAKAIATAHLLEGAGLVSLTSKEYRRALCQMRGMEHVCKAHYKEAGYPRWCKDRVKRDTKPSKWSGRDLHACGLRRAYFEVDRRRWTEPWSYHETAATGQEYHHRKHKGGHGKKVTIHGCPETWKDDDCVGKPIDPKDDVRVRVGEHCDYDRVVFDWPEPVDYEVERYGDEVTISFDHAEDIDVSKVRRDLGRFIVDARSDKGEAGSSATLILASGVDDKVWKWGHRIIVDGRKPGCY